MENATKALLIAAAVIVAILLISLGIGVFNIGQQQTQNADLTEYQIQQFNNKFLTYQGENVSVAEVNAMIKTVLNHNLAQEDKSTCVAVGVEDSINGGRTAVDRTNEPNGAPNTITVPVRFRVFCIIDKRTKLVTDVVAKEVGI